MGHSSLGWMFCCRGLLCQLTVLAAFMAELAAIVTASAVQLATMFLLSLLYYACATVCRDVMFVLVDHLAAE